MSQNYANIICRIALEKVRQAPSAVWPVRHIDEWREGKCAACAALFPAVETLSAANETKFLVQYNERHGVYKS